MAISWDKQTLSAPTPQSATISAVVTDTNFDGTRFAVDFKIEIAGVAKTFLRQVVTVEAANPNKLKVQAFNLEFPGDVAATPGDELSSTGLPQTYPLNTFEVDAFVTAAS